MNNIEMALLNALADDPDIIPYRKRLNEVTGSVTATILLQQILFRAKGKDFKPFFKFRSPCSHKLYRPGDSWTEELGFSLAEFDTALKRIGTKVTKGISKRKAYQGVTPEHLVIYWTDAGRVTWYHINLDLLGKLIIPIYLVNGESGFSKMDNPDLPSPENPKTTTEEEHSEDPPADYLTDIHAHVNKSNKAGVANPADDDAQWLHYRQEALNIYTELTGLHPDAKVARPAIAALASAPDFDPARWRASVESCVLAGVKPRNVACMLDVYEAGGDYRAMVRGSKPANGNGRWYTDEEQDNYFGADPSETPAPDAAEVVWSAALADVAQFMPSPVFNAHLRYSRAKRDNGTLRVILATQTAVDWINKDWLDAITAAVRGVDPSVERVEVGT